VVDSASTVRPRVVRSRLGTTAAGVDGGPRRGAGAGRGGSHGWRRRSPRSGPGGPPLWSARARLLMPVARNQIRFFEIAIRSRQNAVKHPRPENRPLWLDRWVPTQNL
jgi:hypothetical protein